MKRCVIIKYAMIGVALWPLLSSGLVFSSESDCANAETSSHWSGKLTLASDYVFRGESETADGDIPALQGALTWTHCSQWYAGVFVSSNKFKSSPDVDSVVGPYVGKSRALGFADLNYNIFVFHYAYPNSRALDYTELWINVSKNFDQFSLAAEVTPTLNDWFGVDGWRGVNYALHPSYRLRDSLIVSGSMGYQALTGKGAEGWQHWNLGVNQSLKTKAGALALDLRYHDSDIREGHDVYGHPDGLEIFEERVVFGVTVSF